MAKKRMFSLQIVDTDAFLEMPLSTQALYFHLSMRADDDGFVDNYKKIMRMIGSQEDDFKVLLTKRFILGFDNGIIVIKHWRINNYIQNDRYTETTYLEEKSLISEKNNKSYTQCIQVGNTDKIRLDKTSKDKTILQTKVCEEIIYKPLEESKTINKQIFSLMAKFIEFNPGIKINHKTHRSACKDLIVKFGYEKALNTVKYALGLQGKQYVPTITTPTQLINKLGDLKVYAEKQKSSAIVKI